MEEVGPALMNPQPHPPHPLTSSLSHPLNSIKRGRTDHADSVFYPARWSHSTHTHCQDFHSDVQGRPLADKRHRGKYHTWRISLARDRPFTSLVCVPYCGGSVCSSTAS